MTRWPRVLIASLLAGCAGEAAPMLEPGEYGLEVAMSGCFSCTRVPEFVMEPDGRFRGNRLDAELCCEGALTEDELEQLTLALNEADALRRGDGARCIDCGNYRFEVVLAASEESRSFWVASTALDPELEAVIAVIDRALVAGEEAGECEACPPPTRF